jgi:hypothetical protein
VYLLAANVRTWGRWTVLALVALVLVASFLPLPVEPHSAGMVGQTRGGCTCHNQTESFSVTPSIGGLPGGWEPGEEYLLNLTYDGGPARGPGARAGFDLKVSAGELVTVAGSDEVRIDPGTGEATHTLEGANVSTWHVIWRAPSEGKGDVTFSLVVNAVNGDGVQGPGDQWGRLEAEVAEGDPGGLGRASEFWLVVGVVAVLAIAALAWYATRGPRVERR